MRRLRLLTWNIWFGRLGLARRMRSIATQLRYLQPDVVGFQELTSVSELMLREGLGGYQRVPSAPAGSYWEGLWTRLPVGEGSCRRVYRRSGMGRGVTLLHCPAWDLVVGTTHLESLTFAALREEQWLEAMAWIDSFGTAHAVLMGDMNLHDGQCFGHLLPEGWVDAWSVARPEDPGYTYDARRNWMIRDDYRERLDRIFVRSRDWQVEEIGLLGTTPLEEGERSLFSSDHFGVLLDVGCPDVS